MNFEDNNRNCKELYEIYSGLEGDIDPLTVPLPFHEDEGDKCSSSRSFSPGSQKLRGD
jgi:hypothetical protein